MTDDTTQQRSKRSVPASDLFDPAELERLFRAADDRAAREPVEPEPDAAQARARDLADRAEVLLAGDFGLREVDRCRAEDPGLTTAMDHARAFAGQREHTILVLVGGTGCGKTTAATWLARELGGAKPGMIDATDLERRGRYDQTLGDWLAERTLTVIDDLGVEPADAKGYFAALVDGIANRAYKNRRRLVITTNASGADLKARLGARIWSRICEAATVAECGAVDLRRGGTVTAIRAGGR